MQDQKGSTCTLGEKRDVVNESPALPSASEEEAERGLSSGACTTEQTRLATEEETANYPHITERLPLAAIIVILVGGVERFAYYAVTTPWQNYMQNQRTDPAVPGALGLGQSIATNINNAYLFFTFLMPMPFALVSDLYLGRYNTLLISLCIYMAGCLIQFVSALPFALDNGAGVGGLAASMILIGIGAGGVKATLSPFLGDQYIQRPPQATVRKDKSIAVTDPVLTLQFIYNLYYWAVNIASLSSVPATFLERIYDFWAAYLLAFVSIWISIILLVFCKKKLVRYSARGHNLPTISRIIWIGARNGFKLNHAKPSYQLEVHHTRVPWTDEFVDEVKQGLLACRLLLSFVIFYLCINQMYNNLISQAGQTQLHGVPNDMIQALAGVACVILGPVIQAGYSFLARHHIKPGPMIRITVAFVLCAGGMAYSAGTQQIIYNAGPCFDHPRACPASDGGRLPNNISVWVQTPVYWILAAAEIFGFVTASQYSYTWAPKDAKAIVQALTQLTACLGSALGMAISPVAKDPFLVIMYSCLAGAMGLSAGGFWLIFGKYDKIEKDKQQEAARDGGPENGTSE